MALTENAKKRALSLMKTRLNRTPADTSLDEHFTARLDAAEKEMQRQGIRMTDAMDDVMLLVDKATFDYQNRDKQQGQPDWLKSKLRGRWLNQRDT